MIGEEMAGFELVFFEVGWIINRDIVLRLMGFC